MFLLRYFPQIVGWLPAQMTTAGAPRQARQATARPVATSRLSSVRQDTDVGRTHQAGEGGDFAPVAKGPPTEELLHQEPGARWADRPRRIR
jgi:hypothetical protein